MNVLLSPLTEKRTGLTCVDKVTSIQGPFEDGIGVAVVEPTFIDFEGAANSALAGPFAALSALHGEPDHVVVNISYTPQNARSYKGYIADIIEFAKTQGYEQSRAIHMPYQKYGAGIIGSRLALFFGHEELALDFHADEKMAGDVIPDLHYHAKNGAQKYVPGSGSLAAGDSLRSDNAFLPPITDWGSKMLLCEYREGQTLRQYRFRPKDVRRVFGVEELLTNNTLAYCTPPPVIDEQIRVVGG